MKQEIIGMIEDGKISEIEIMEFLSTLKKLSKNNIIDSRNYQLVIDHFGFKKKKGWIKINGRTKYKIR